MIAAGAAAVIGAALLFHNMSTESAEGGSDKMLAEIALLGEIKRDQNGLLSFHYYKELFLIVNKYVRERNAPSKKEMVEERRGELKKGDMAAYTAIVQEILKKEEGGF